MGNTTNNISQIYFLFYNFYNDTIIDSDPNDFVLIFGDFQ